MPNLPFQNAVDRAEGAKQTAMQQARRDFERDVHTQPKRQAAYDASIRAADRTFLQDVIEAADKFNEPLIANTFRERLAGLK